MHPTPNELRFFPPYSPGHSPLRQTHTHTHTHTHTYPPPPHPPSLMTCANFSHFLQPRPSRMCDLHKFSLCKTETQQNPRQGREKCSRGTNLHNQGLISADRNNKATLLLTIPSYIFKSSAKDLSRAIFEIMILHTAA